MMNAPPKSKLAVATARRVANGKSIPVRELLKDKAYIVLKERILNDEYPPGSFLAERKLADQLGMSKTPVKAALERLEMEGFVTISPQQCILVRDLSITEIADQYEVRTALETYVLRSVAGKLTPDQKLAVERNLQAQAESHMSLDVAHKVDLDATFHKLFAEFLGNQTILQIMSDLRDKMQRVLTRVFQLQPDRFEASYAEHLAIAQAVFEGNGEQAAQHLTTHLGRGRQLILTPRRS